LAILLWGLLAKVLKISNSCGFRCYSGAKALHHPSPGYSLYPPASQQQFIIQQGFRLLNENKNPGQIRG